MVKPTRVKIAIIGIGGIGRLHAGDIDSLDNTELVAICDIDKARAERWAAVHNVPAFSSHVDMFERCSLDAVLIATPHCEHPPIALDAFQHGIHVLTEKPIAVHVKAAQEMIAGYENALKQYPYLVFAAMFQQRTYGSWNKIKTMIDEGELGRLVRVTWIITDWFRTQSYYDNGGWRATWKGEGGGVLLNQCPHNLDLLQWFIGMPRLVVGFAGIGKYHDIEVEDEVSAYMEYKNGMICHFITSTAESPGSNRLEIVGEKGKLIFEDHRLVYFRNRGSMLDHIANSTSGFEMVESERFEMPYSHHDQPGHKWIIDNFANAIINKEKPIAPGVEGINSLILGNAIMMSAFLGEPIYLPLDADAYAEKLQDLINNSRFQKHVVEREVDDLENSF